MLRAVLDANVLVSALLHPSGPPGKIVTAFLTSRPFELLISPTIFLEVEATFRKQRVRKYLPDRLDAEVWLADIAILSDLVEDTGDVVGVCRDPDDDKILAAAVGGRADVLVSGDQDLLTLREYEGIAIITPRAFWELLDR